jgi:uncharacterized protein YktA (UPF0223 family)
MSGFLSLEIPFWPKRTKRQKPDAAEETAVAASEERAAEASVSEAQEPTPEPQKAAETPRAEPQEQERPQDVPPVAQRDAAQGASPGARRLWGRDFTVVNGGLSPDQVISFFESVRAEYEKRLQRKGDSTTWDSFSKQVMAEAEREAARIRLRAQQEAEVEAARLISEGKRRAQEETEKASRRAQEITEKGVQDILAAANKKAQIAESRARQLSQLMLIRAREDIQDHITGEVQRAYHKLSGMLEDMMGSAKGIEAEWREKTLELWNSPALEEAMDETLLLGEGQIEALQATSPPVVPEEEPAASQHTPQEQMTEPTDRVDLSAPAEASSLVEDPVVDAQEVIEESPPSVDPEEIPSNDLVAEPAPEPLAPQAQEIVIGEEPLLSPEEPPLAPIIEEKPEAEQSAQQKDERSSPGLGEVLTPKRDDASRDDEVKFEDLYNGEVDLILAPPVDFGRVSELYSHLQTLPEVRVLHTAGSWEQGTVVTLILDKAGPLIGPLKTLHTIDAKPLLTPTSSGLLKSAMGSLGEKGRRRQRISIAFKESEAPQPVSDTTMGQETSS